MNPDDQLPASPCLTGDTQQRLDRIERSVEQIKAALVGNPAIGHRGIVPRIDAIETTVASIVAERATEKSKLSGGLAVITALGAVAGILGGIIHWLFSNLTGRA
jgi:tetrahydromethanopterin S-methyltransferase subunit G